MRNLLSTFFTTLGLAQLLNRVVVLLRVPSVVLLLLVNLVPIIGAMFFNWSIFDLLIAYWTENLVIGIFNVFKILLAQGSESEHQISMTVNDRPLQSLSKAYQASFFFTHYGIFTFVHGVFVFGMFSEYEGAVFPYAFYGIIGFSLAVFFSHAFSFFYNFVGKREYLRNSPSYYFALPYSRIIPVHITIIVGAFIAESTGLTLPVVILFSILKIGVDLAGHSYEHRNMNPAATN